MKRLQGVTELPGISRSAAATDINLRDALSVRGDGSYTMRCRKKLRDALSVRTQVTTVRGVKRVAVHQCCSGFPRGLCARTGTLTNGRSVALRATVPSYLHSAQDDHLPSSWMSSPVCRLQDVPVPSDLAPEHTTGVMDSARSNLR